MGGVLSAGLGHRLLLRQPRKATYGDPARWNYLTTTLAAKDMAQPANYTELQGYLDVEAFADYLLNAWWFGVTDWPTNNWYATMRTTSPTVPAMFVAWDGEWSMDRKIGNPHQGSWLHPEFAPNASPTTIAGKLWKSAWASPSFRSMFVDRVALRTGVGGALSDDVVLARYDASTTRCGRRSSANRLGGETRSNPSGFPCGPVTVTGSTKSM